MSEQETDRTPGPVVRLDDGAPDGVAVLELRNPPMNALSHAVQEALGVALDAIEGDTAVRAVVVAGEGKAFSAGAEISELPVLADPDAADAQVRRIHALLDRVAALRCPTVAALDGPAVGGGLELALACDLRVAGPRARLGLPEVGLGLIPGAGGTQRLPAVVGTARALELVLGGELVDGPTALALGLVQRLAGPGETARAGARAWAADLAGRPAVAVAAAKRAVRAAGTPEGYAVEREQFVAASRSADAAEGIAAFLDRRTPTFHHR